MDNLTKRLGQLPRSRCAARIGPISGNIPSYTYGSPGAARRLRGCAAIPTLSRGRLTWPSGGFRRSDRTRLRRNAFVRYARSSPPLALWRPAARSLRFTRFCSCRRLISRCSSRSGRRGSAATWAGVACHILHGGTGRFFRVGACLRPNTKHIAQGWNRLF